MATQTPFDALLERVRDIAGESGLQQLLPDVDRLFAQFELVPRATFENHLRSLTELQARIDTLEAQVATLEAERANS